MENQKKNNLETVRQFCSKWYIVIILFSVITIFWEIIVEFIDDIFIIPFFEPSADRIADGNIWVFIAVLAPYLPYYIIKWDSIQKEQETISIRRKCLILIAFVYSIFRFSGLYVYYGWGWLKYSDCFVYLPLIGEFILWIISVLQRPKPAGTAVCPFYPDFPTTEDSFGRGKYVDVLIEKINSTFINAQKSESNEQNGAFTILLNEEYGSGKSSFFKVIKKKLNDKDNKDITDITCVEFNPLLLARKDDIVTHFFKSFLGGIYDRSFEKTIMAYSKALSLHYINTIGSLFEQKNKSLESQYDDISKYLKGKKHKILILIDDVDRLQIDELLTVLKLIRSTASFSNVIYLIAADKSALIKCLEASDISDGDTYLKKFFNFELLFPASYHSVMDEFYKKLSDLYKTFGLKYQAPRLPFPNSLFSNMRDVYRYLNLLSFSMESLHKPLYGNNVSQNENISRDINIDDLIQLTLVQFFDAHYYRILRDHNDRFLKISSNDPTVLVLKDGEAFCDRSLKDNILESRKIAIGNQAQTSELEVRNSFPNTEDIILRLICNMFYDCVHNNDNQRSICFESEYYKYFVGSYREDEWTNAKVVEVMRKNDDEFKIMSENRRQKGEDYWDSYLHKILCFIIEADYSPIDIIKKVIILIQVDYDKSNQWRSLSSYYSIKFRDMVFSCLNKHRSNNKLYPDLTDFFNEDTRIHHLSLILNIIDTYLRHSGDTVCYTHLNNWKNGLIDRFIKQMTENPSDIEISNAFYDVKLLSKDYFNNCFHKYLISSADPLTWLYRFVKLENGVFSWDLYYWCGMLGDNDLSSFVVESYGDILTTNLVLDIKQLSNANELSSYSKEEHPFLMAAEKWIMQGGTCNVSEGSGPK